MTDEGERRRGRRDDLRGEFGGNGAFVTEIDEDETVVGAIVRAVAAVSGEDPLSMEPLGRVVDPDAVNALCGGPDGRGRLSFRFNDCRVFVRPGEVGVDPDGSDASAA